jgi:hypothetical protein
LLDQLSAQLPYVTDWSGCGVSGLLQAHGNCCEPAAMAVMLCDLRPDDYRVFSGLSPLPPAFASSTLLLHADARTPELPELLSELCAGTSSRQLQGALLEAPAPLLQVAWSSHGQLPDLPACNRNRAVFEGGLSGLALSPAVHWQTRTVAGWCALGPVHRISALHGSVLTHLDERDALEVLLEEAGLGPGSPHPDRSALPALLRQTWIESSHAGDATPKPHGTALHAILGLDRASLGLALAPVRPPLQVGMQLRFCQHDSASAQRELRRVGTALRAAFEPRSLTSAQARQLALDRQSWDGGMAGALYFRSPAQAASLHAEWQSLRHALGPVPALGLITAAALDRQQRTESGLVLSFGTH